MKFKLYKFPPLIEIVTTETNLHCDNPVCNYISPINFPIGELENHINEPCPECNLSLLTREDYELYVKMQNSVKFINKYFSWIQIFWFWKIKKSRESYQSMSVHGHHGKFNITEIKEKA